MSVPVLNLQVRHAFGSRRTNNQCRNLLSNGHYCDSGLSCDLWRQTSCSTPGNMVEDFEYSCWVNRVECWNLNPTENSVKRVAGPISDYIIIQYEVTWYNSYTVQELLRTCEPRTWYIVTPYPAYCRSLVLFTLDYSAHNLIDPAYRVEHKSRRFMYIDY